MDKAYLPTYGKEESPEIAWQDSVTLQELEELTHTCRKCALSSTRKNFVFGAGNPDADIVLIGEAPGATEDQIGRPFVGEAGQLLDKILAAIQLKREQVYICNILKCRPPNNRDPLPQEVTLCTPYLFKQIALIKPPFILCLGRHAAQTLLDTTQSLSALRGRVHDWRGHRLLVTYHPAALLRYTQFKRDTWEDVQLLRRLYDEFLQNQLS
ncbi:uracil-DNA glycosylase [candidate division KSB1 bacterium]|nr:uracil-DNA glycosylase [candidate division KSB1 bacterium]